MYSAFIHDFSRLVIGHAYYTYSRPSKRTIVNFSSINVQTSWRRITFEVIGRNGAFECMGSDELRCGALTCRSRILNIE
jgi:hypothetical protein